MDGVLVALGEDVYRLGLKWADTCVLVLPCGRSAHTEAGWMAGAGKRVIAFIPEMVEPELMYKLFDRVVGNLDDLVGCI